MNILGSFLILATLAVLPSYSAWAEATVAATPTLSAASLEEERKRLELERLQLENEKLKLELERMKLRSEAQALEPAASKEKEGASKGDAKGFQSEASGNAEILAKERSNEVFLLIPDFVNAEVWVQGVRHNLHELEILAADRKWTLLKEMHSRSMKGYPRTLYRVRNVTLLKYQGKERGIIELTPPRAAEDLRFLTPDGLSFDSGVGDVRNAYQSIYFKYDGQHKRDGLTVLRYNHSRGLAFSDKLEFLFDKEGKMVKVRYGVLDEK